MFLAPIAYANAEKAMSNQNYGGQRRDGGTGGQDPRSKAGVSSITADAAEKAKQFASDAAETVTGVLA